jgi:mono/diheme cytochrome c family protein
MTRSPEPSEKRPISRSGLVLAVSFSVALAANSVLAEEASGTGTDMPTVEQDFRFHCAACHGADAKGGGPVARILKIAPPDLTRIAERNGGVFPETMIFGTISGVNMPIAHGTREMPVWGYLFIGEILEESVSVEQAQEATGEVTDRIKRLVKYIETIQVVK